MSLDHHRHQSVMDGRRSRLNKDSASTQLDHQSAFDTVDHRVPIHCRVVFRRGWRMLMTYNVFTLVTPLLFHLANSPTSRSSQLRPFVTSCRPTGQTASNIPWQLLTSSLALAASQPAAIRPRQPTAASHPPPARPPLAARPPFIRLRTAHAAAAANRCARNTAHRSRLHLTLLYAIRGSLDLPHEHSSINNPFFGTSLLLIFFRASTATAPSRVSASNAGSIDISPDSGMWRLL